MTRAQGYLRRSVTSAGAISLELVARTLRLEIRVELKPGILDAEAESIARSLALLGIAGVREVTTARIYDLEFEGTTESEAHRRAQEAVDRLLANPVIHRVTIRPPPD
ncbi:MAG TPA: phosphoribosylformylglycinamidine synthase subunit PurS [Thermoplasmata archaeon]|nr:phosphoribosylformylglycinamidine synthase subunit PurS [Thermoplasmata archaeon]